MSPSAVRPIRIPIKLVDGQWEYFYGGQVPIEEGAIAELVVDRTHITNRGFLTQFTKRSSWKILTENAELYVALSVRDFSAIASEAVQHLVPMSVLQAEIGLDFFELDRSNAMHFVQISLAGPTEAQKRRGTRQEGGIWLELAGMNPKGISSGQVKLPGALRYPTVDSLNEAFTRLSEAYEPWRKSHTGNIYKNVLYRERNNKLYPLDVLRNAALASTEHELVQERWNAFLAEMRGKRTNS